MIGRDLKRAIAIETAISIAINTAGSLLSATWSAAPASAFGLAPQWLAGGFMCALVPSLLMRGRARRGRLGALVVARTPGLGRIAPVALILAAAAGLFGVAVVGAGMPAMAHHSTAMLLMRGGCGAAIGAGVTPAALLLLFASGQGASLANPYAARKALSSPRSSD